MTRTSDTRITGYEPLLAPSALLDQLPLGDEAAATVEQSRGEVRAVLDGADDRLLVIAGPCSVHDPAAALEYAGRLRDARERHHADLLIVMRVYFEKPRTVTGWKGLINDPGMDRPEASWRWTWLSVVRAPIAPQVTVSAMYCGVIGSSHSQPTGMPRLRVSMSSRRAVRSPRCTS